MKRWQKITIGIAAVLVLLVVILVVTQRSSMKILMGAGGIEGPKEVIPEAKAEADPVKKGKYDWPCWRGPNGDGVSSIKGIRKDWEGGLKKLWEVNHLCQDDDSGTWSAPSIRGNRLVVPGRDADNDLVLCLDPATGDVLWKTSYPAKAKTQHGRGARATPFIDEDKVYTYGRSGDLVCWSLADGKKIWHKNVSDEGGTEPTWGHSSSPILRGNAVLVQAGGTSLVIAYDKMTGDVLWKSGEGTAGYAPVVDATLGRRDELLVFHGTGLAGLDPESGKQLWNIEWRTSYDVNATTPVVDGNTVFITSDYGRGGALIRIAGAKPQVVWETKAIASHHSDPYFIGGYLYGYSGMSAQNNGDFTCVDAKTGEAKWTSGDVGWGTCVLIDGHFLSVDIFGNVYLIKPDPAGLKKITEMKSAFGEIEGPVWTLPVAANGRLYLRFKQRLACYDLMKK